MKRFTVIGLGRFGFHAAQSLFEDGHEVIAIDSDRAMVQDIESHCSEAIVLDATDKDRLNVLGLDAMDAVIVSIGTQISNSILICLYLKEIGVKRIIAKALDEDHGKILRQIGATDIVHPEKDSAIRVARGLSTPNILDFIPLSKNLTMAHVESPKEFIGQTLSDLNLRARYNINVVAIKEAANENIVQVPPPDFQIKQGDVLLMFGKSEDIKRIKALS